MKMVTAIIKPFKLDEVREAISYTPKIAQLENVIISCRYDNVAQAHRLE